VQSDIESALIGISHLAERPRAQPQNNSSNTGQG
jgi:hypothetical protein